MTGTSSATRRHRRTLLPVSLLVLAVIGAACGSGGSTREGSDSGRPATLTVLAAASLTEAFGELGHLFEEAHPGVAVRFSFGPSDGLSKQIDEGAPADVFASASPAWMDDVQRNGPGITGRVDFAQNVLTLITPEDDPASIESVGDLARPGVTLVLAAEGVPAGDYAREMLKNAGIERDVLANVVSNEEDVKAVVQKVLLGETDAGIVYRTDLTAGVAKQVRSVAIPSDVNVIATYPIGVVGGSPHADLAAAFVDLVAGPGQTTLRRYRFLPPPG